MKFSRRDFINLSLLNLAGFALISNTGEANAQSIMGSAFTYQGFLMDSNVPANGSYEFQFELFDAPSGGNKTGGTLSQTTTVIDGQFSVVLDFGVDAFPGIRRYLEIKVRQTGSGSFTTLSPRQELTPTPHALHSRSAFYLNAADSDPTEAVYVDNEGWVGIGTKTPGEKLHLADGHFLIEGGGETQIIIKRDETFTGGPSGNSPNPKFHIGRIIQAGDGDPEIRVLYSDDITQANPDPNEREIPIFEFDRKGVVASVKQDRGSHFEGFISSTDPEPIFRLNSWPKMRLEMGEGGTAPVDVALQRETADTLTILTGNTERLRVDSVGNIGIGTTNPTERLHVNGGNIIVTGGSFIDDGTTLNVPDYVFDEDYPLKPLDELRSYIAQEKHLPNVPSSIEIKKNGLNVSEFQLTLLEKIEELTLYTLAQQERIEALELEITMLKEQVTERY
ncbi:MAG: hypothetical protein ACFFCW_33820 [Candidatus Hodarchaeota archaeon]